MIAAPAKITQGAAAPLTSVAPTTTTSAPVTRNLGHQLVRRVRATRAPLRRAGLLAGAAGRPSAPGTGGTGPSLSRRRDRAVISTPGPWLLVAQHGNSPVCRSDAERVQMAWRSSWQKSITCLQSDVSTRCGGADLARQLSVSSREVPLPTPVNGTTILEPTGNSPSVAQRPGVVPHAGQPAGSPRLTSVGQPLT